MRKDGAVVRVCKACQTEVVEGYLGGVTAIHAIVQPQLAQNDVGKVRCGICPKCGQIDLYLEDLSQVRHFVKRD